MLSFNWTTQFFHLCTSVFLSLLRVKPFGFLFVFFVCMCLCHVSLPVCTCEIEIWQIVSMDSLEVAVRVAFFLSFFLCTRTEPVTWTGLSPQAASPVERQTSAAKSNSLPSYWSTPWPGHAVLFWTGHQGQDGKRTAGDRLWRADREFWGKEEGKGKMNVKLGRSQTTPWH